MRVLLMTPAERAVVDQLAAAWNAFMQLPVEHPMDLCRGIHILQDKVLARPARRALNSVE